MAVIEFCVNTTILPIWNHGLSQCFYQTVQPIVVFLLAIISFLYHTYLKWKCKQRQTPRKPKSRVNPSDFQRIGLIQHADDIETVPVVEIEDDAKEEPSKQKCFKDFPFPKLPIPFLYVVQLLLHSLLLILPVLHIILKIILAKDRLAGVQIMSSVLNFCAWLVGFHTLKQERKIFFVAKLKRHSIGMLLFWTVAHVLEALVFTSWNNKNSFLRNHEEGVQLMEVIMFAFRFAATFFIFILGLHAPGLYKTKYATVSSSIAKDLLLLLLIRQIS